MGFMIGVKCKCCFVRVQLTTVAEFSFIVAAAA